MASKGKQAAGQDGPIILKLTDGKAGEKPVNVAIDRASLTFRKVAEIRRKAKGGASAPCILYATGELKHGKHAIKVSLQFTTDIDTATALGVTCKAATPKVNAAGEVRTRAATFDELVAMGRIA